MSHPKITAWSYSRYNEYATCPRKSFYKVIQRLKEPGSPAMDRGTTIHKMAENYVLGGGPLPAELALFADEFKELRKQKAAPEKEWCFTKDWVLTAWLAPDAWCRIKTDAYALLKRGAVARVIDYKTGKVRPEHKDQLSLYALATFLVFSKVEQVDAELWYLDQGPPIVSKTFKRESLPELVNWWSHKVIPMLNDTEYCANPNYLCRYCHFRKANGGPCEF